MPLNDVVLGEGVVIHHRDLVNLYGCRIGAGSRIGAFVEILPGTEALLHISEMRHGRTEKTEDVVKKGDRVKVKLIDRDERGRLRLSMKALQPKPEGETGDGGGNGEFTEHETGTPDLAWIAYIVAEK